jgi:hypothetical protein
MTHFVAHVLSGGPRFVCGDSSEPLAHHLPLHIAAPDPWPIGQPRGRITE